MGDWFERIPLGALPERAARTWPEREALVAGSRRESFGVLAGAVDRAAAAFLAVGVEPGHKVAIWLPNRPAWIHAFFGALRIGAVVVPLNTRLRSHDLGYVLRHCDARVLIVAGRSGPVDHLGVLRELVPELDRERLSPCAFPELVRVVIDEAHGPPAASTWSSFLAEGEGISRAEVARRAAAVDPEAPALLMYTSGSTGHPKGVVHGHRLVRNVTDQANRLGVTPADTILMYLPLFHAFGLYEGVLMNVLTGARLVLQEHFEPEAALALLESERCTLLHGFDTHFADLLRCPRLARTDRSSLRTGVLAAGMAGSEGVAREVQARLCPTVSGWGMTEVGVGATLGFLDEDEAHRCLGSGHPLPGYELRVVDPESGRPFPADQAGELQVRGYMLMQGYYKDPGATRASFTDDGWFRTGDRAVFRDDGSMRFLGRYKEMLKVGGENVDPFEVEGFLLEHPAVAQVQVVGAPDPRLSEVPVACVILAEGARADAAELAAHCRGRLAGFKIPRRFFFVKELPVTSTGKVQRFRLREQVVDWLRGGPGA